MLCVAYKKEKKVTHLLIVIVIVIYLHSINPD